MAASDPAADSVFVVDDEDRSSMDAEGTAVTAVVSKAREGRGRVCW